MMEDNFIYLWEKECTRMIIWIHLKDYMKMN